MLYELIKTEHGKLEVGAAIDFDDLNVGDAITFMGDYLTVVQTGEFLTLASHDKLYVFKRKYVQMGYITDYKDIIEGEHLSFILSSRLIDVKVPMSMEALYNYIKCHTNFVEPVIRCIGDNEYEFINGWRLTSNSHENIKSGRYTYESKVIQIKL